MRRFMTTVACALVMSSLTACGVQAGDDVEDGASAIEGTQQVGKKVKVDGDGLRIRTGPSTRRTVLGLLYRGDMVEIAEAEPTDGFYKVKVLTVADARREELVGKQGWVAGQFLLDEDAAPPDTSARDEELGPVSEEEMEQPETSTCSDATNATAATAKVLPAFTDHRSGRFQDTLADQVLGESEAWFTFEVKDQGLNGNPDVRVMTREDLEVTVFYKCTNGGDASTCNVGEAVTENGLSGCKGDKTADVYSSCNSSDESGQATVRIRRKSGDTNTCSSFLMQVQIN